MTLSPPSRREFLKLVSASAAALAAPVNLRSQELNTEETNKRASGYTLRIQNGEVEVGKNPSISTTTYNGQFPGPLLCWREGEGVTVDIHNQTDTPEQLHWHGQKVPVDVDGAAEEETPFIMPGATRRIAFIPQPSGLRSYHTHVRAGGGHESRPIYGPGRPGVHRAPKQSGALRSRGLSHS